MLSGLVHSRRAGGAAKLKLRVPNEVQTNKMESTLHNNPLQIFKALLQLIDAKKVIPVLLKPEIA